MFEDTRARAGVPTRAVVCAGGEQTEYLRAGSGAVVVLLSREHDGPQTMELIASLSTEFLVIAPKLPRGGDFGNWLSGVMDGLGIALTTIAAETAFITDVLRFAAAEDGRVQRVALLHPDNSGSLQNEEPVIERQHQEDLGEETSR